MAYMESDFGQSNIESRYYLTEKWSIRYTTIHSACFGEKKSRLSRGRGIVSSSRHPWLGKQQNKWDSSAKSTCKRKSTPVMEKAKNTKRKSDGNQRRAFTWWKALWCCAEFPFYHGDLSGFQTCIVSTRSINNKVPWAWPGFRPDCNSTCYLCFRQ